LTSDAQSAGGGGSSRLSPYTITALTARLVFGTAFRLEVVSPERIPAQGPLVIVANHESYLDGPLLMSVFSRRHLTFFSAAYLFEQPATGWALRRLGALPVNAQGSNLDSLKKAIAILKGGGTMAIFPGGGIARDEVLGGAAYVALKANAPVLPLQIEGTNEALPPGEKLPHFAPITVRVGTLVPASEMANGCADTRNAVAEGTRMLARVLAGTRPAWRDICRRTVDG